MNQSQCLLKFLCFGNRKKYKRDLLVAMMAWRPKVWYVGKSAFLSLVSKNTQITAANSWLTLTFWKDYPISMKMCTLCTVTWRWKSTLKSLKILDLPGELFYLLWSKFKKTMNWKYHRKIYLLHIVAQNWKFQMAVSLKLSIFDPTYVGSHNVFEGWQFV